MAKNMNPTKVITGKDTRWSYCNVWDAKSINSIFRNAICSNLRNILKKLIDTRQFVPCHFAIMSISHFFDRCIVIQYAQPILFLQSISD